MHDYVTLSCDILVGTYIRFNLTKQWDASFLRWYDTGQAHILSNSIIRNCGVRSLDDVEFDEYNQSPERGCPFDDSNLGCDNDSSVWSFNSVRCTLHPFLLWEAQAQSHSPWNSVPFQHSDKFVPEIMQATTNITYENCGRRFRFIQGDLDSASARQQNWLDADGSASGLGEPTLIGSGIASVTSWWNVDDDGKKHVVGSMATISGPSSFPGD